MTQRGLFLRLERAFKLQSYIPAVAVISAMTRAHVGDDGGHVAPAIAIAIDDDAPLTVLALDLIGTVASPRPRPACAAERGRRGVDDQAGRCSPVVERFWSDRRITTSKRRLPSTICDTTPAISTIASRASSRAAGRDAIERSALVVGRRPS